MSVKNKITIVYMGTPDFAVPPITELNRSPFEIQLIVTQPDRPVGRGRKVCMPPVKQAAIAAAIPVIQPDSIKNREIEAVLQRLSPDFFVVCAYGHILPKRILDIPKFGSINIHASLLPRFRGAAPIQWAIIREENETGITTIRMDEGMDTGDILLKEHTPILPGDTSQTLHDRLSEMGAKLIGKTLSGIVSGEIKAIPQDHANATYAPMLRKEDGHIDWCRSAKSIDAFIRGVTPWPGAYCFCGEKRFKIYKASAIASSESDLPGTIVSCSCSMLHVATKDGIISVEEIQESSGKRLSVRDFLCGCTTMKGTHFC